jgi:hypothetical protein
MFNSANYFQICHILLVSVQDDFFIEKILEDTAALKADLPRDQ